ncbi:MAG: hypothetical protein ACYC5N_00700, partial [Endomicrobiales bacterium]
MKRGGIIVVQTLIGQTTAREAGSPFQDLDLQLSLVSVFLRSISRKGFFTVSCNQIRQEYVQETHFAERSVTMMKKLLLAGMVFGAFPLFAGSAGAEMHVTGFAQVQAVYDESQTDREVYFTAKRARLIAKGSFEKVGLFAQMETFTAAINLLDLVIDYELESFGRVGLGRFTVPFGIQNPVSPYNLYTINYAQVVQRLIGSGARDFGLRWAGKYNMFNWTVVGINGSDGGTTVVLATENNNVKDITGRLGLSPRKGIDVGFSAYNGEAGAAKTAKSRLGLDVKYENDSVLAQAEYIMGKDGSTEKAGYYIEAGYTFTALNPRLQPIVRYEHY